MGPNQRSGDVFLTPSPSVITLKGCTWNDAKGWSQLHWETWGMRPLSSHPLQHVEECSIRNRLGMDGTTPTATAPSPILHIPVACEPHRPTFFFFFFFLRAGKNEFTQNGWHFLIFEIVTFLPYSFLSGRGETVNLCVKFSYYCSTDQKMS